MRPGTELAPQSHVEHRQWGPGVVMDSESDRVTVLFDSVGYKTLARQAVGDGPLRVAGAGQDGEAQDGEAQDGEAQDGEAQDGEAQEGKAQDGEQNERVTAGASGE